MTTDPAAQPTAEESTTNDSLRAEMARRRVTQAQIAEVLQISQAQVSARLNGGVRWRVDELVKVCRLLGVGISDVVKEAAA